MVPRLKERYEREILPELSKELGVDNVMALPRLDKIVLNMGMGEAVANPKILEAAVEELSAIAGQRAVVTKAKKSIATYKLRAGMPIGVRVTLRGRRMYEFLDRLINIALPRVRDFRGVSPKAFDGRLLEDGQVEGIERDDRDQRRTRRSRARAPEAVGDAVRIADRDLGLRTEDTQMARRAMRIKADRKPKFMTRKVRRCRVCGRARSVLRKFGLCRICFRSNANAGYIPGIIKASW